MALGSLTGAVAETGYETYVRKKHQEGIPSAEINLFSFICSETAVSAVLLARGMKSIRDQQPQKAAQPWHRRNKMLRLEVFYLIPALPKAKGLPISSQLAFQRFGYLNSFRLCWFAESLQMVALLINISLAGGCATWSSRDHLPFTWAQQLVIVTYFAIWLRTLPFYSLVFFSFSDAIWELESAVSGWSERELMHDQTQHQLQSLNGIQAFPSVPSSTPPHKALWITYSQQWGLAAEFCTHRFKLWLIWQAASWHYMWLIFQPERPSASSFVVLHQQNPCRFVAHHTSCKLGLCFSFIQNLQENDALTHRISIKILNTKRDLIFQFIWKQQSVEREEND